MSLSERATRKQHVDRALTEAGWAPIVPYDDHTLRDLVVFEEHPTASGPADYALFHTGEPLAIVEAKKLGVGPQNVLKQRFQERDDMYFPSHQVAEYDRRRMQVSRVEQLALFVTDEKSAIQWLRRELDPSTGSGPQTYQDLQPKFLRELHQARHEALPELSDVLAQNFLKDEQDRWCVPDPARQEDLEKLRERSLLREFQENAQGKGRLRVFRTEAVAGRFQARLARAGLPPHRQGGRAAADVGVAGGCRVVDVLRQRADAGGVGVGAGTVVVKAIDDFIDTLSEVER